MDPIDEQRRAALETFLRPMVADNYTKSVNANLDNYRLEVACHTPSPGILLLLKVLACAFMPTIRPTVNLTTNDQEQTTKVSIGTQLMAALVSSQYLHNTNNMALNGSISKEPKSNVHCGNSKCYSNQTCIAKGDGSYCECNLEFKGFNNTCLSKWARSTTTKKVSLICCN